MKSYRILRHSIQQITGNPRAALMLSIPLVIALIAMQAFMPTTPVVAEDDTMPALDVGFLFISLLAFGASLLLAVNWHRHVLLEEPATLRPRGGRMGVYLLRALQIGLLAMVVMVVIALAGMAISAVAGLSAALFAAPAELSTSMILLIFLGSIVGLVIGFWIYALMMRLSVMLPAAAVGKGLGLRQALAQTRGTTGTMVMLVLLMGLLAIVLAIPMIVAQLAGLFVLVSVLEFALNWFLTVLGVSLLTTLYGHYVEGRPLN